MKTCTACHENKLEEEFHVTDSQSGRRRGDCKSCVAVKYKIRVTANPSKYAEIRLAANRKHKYGVTRETISELLNQQNSTCAICPTQITFQSAHVDHCHTTLVVRGLLCRYCSFGLGQFRDNVKNIHKAIEYLRRGDLN